jgi:hypothetical protein
VPKNYALEANYGVELKHCTFLVLIVDGYKWSAIHSSHFVHSDLLDAWVGSRGVMDMVVKQNLDIHAIASCFIDGCVHSFSSGLVLQKLTV